MAEWLERAVTVQEVSGSSPVEADTKSFADVGNLLTTSISAGLSKDSDFIHLIHTTQSQDNTTSLLTTA